jgi:hypothetical protein
MATFHTCQDWADVLAFVEAAATDEWCVCGEEVTDETEEEHKDCGLDAQAWSGVFPESLREQLTNILTAPRVHED